MRNLNLKCLWPCIFLAGCGAGVDPTDGTLRSNNGEQKAEETTKAKDDLVIDGKKYKYRGKAKKWEGNSPSPLPGEVQVHETAPPGPKMRSYDDLPDEALAEAMRPIVFYDDSEYILEKPDVEMAKRIKEAVKNRTPARTEGFVPPGLKKAIPPGQEGSDTAEFVIGSDDRVHLNHWSYPESTVTHLFGVGHDCTATAVGPHTFLTAAHCLIANSGQWYGWPNVVPGRDTSDIGNERPYGTWNNIARAVPQQYVGSNEDWFWDFAIIVTWGIYEDPRPGDLTGWMGIIVQDSPDPIWDRWLGLYGYPVDKTPFGSPWGHGRCCDQSNSFWFDDKLIFYYMDAVHGQSGAGVHTWDGGWPYVRIIHQAERTMWWNSYNTGRLIDSGVFNFFASMTPDF